MGEGGEEGVLVEEKIRPLANKSVLDGTLVVALKSFEFRPASAGSLRALRPKSDG